MKSIVLGSNGYLGRNMVHFLQSKNEHVICCDIHDSPEDTNLDYKKIDITNVESISNLNLNVDFIFLFSGITGTWTGFEEYNKFIDINEKGLLNLLKVYNEQKSKARIIFPSTRLVYKGKKLQPINEEEEKQPKTIYALNKIACENILQMYRMVFNINYSVFRICVPYGQLISGAMSYGTIDFFLNNAKNKQNIILYGDGLVYRTFSHIEDICLKIYESILKSDSNGQVYNIGGESRSLLAIAKLIAEKYNVRVEFKPWPENILNIESGDTIFNAQKIEKVTSTQYLNTIENWLNFIE